MLPGAAGRYPNKLQECCFAKARELEAVVEQVGGEVIQHFAEGHPTSK